MNKGCKFSDFSLISDLFISTPLQNIFEISPLMHFSHDFIIDIYFQKKSLNAFRLFH